MPGDRALVAQHALDLRPARLRQDVAEHVDGELLGERIRPQPGDALHVGGVADDVQRQALARPRLGDVEPGRRCPSTIRAASGDLLLGRGGSAGTSSFQRTQPARARCSTRWVPETSMSRNLPWRVTLSTMPPDSAEIGGS